MALLYVDNRAGSKELFPLLCAKGLPAVLTRMDYADISFLGVGPEGDPVGIGVEVKTLRDVLSCIADGRFAGHQLPGLIQSYDQVWLLIAGLWRANAKTGMLEYRKRKGTWEEASVGTRRFMARDLMTWLMTIEIKGGIRSVRVPDWGDAVVWLSALYGWWNSKGWDGHNSHLVFHDGSRHGTPYKRDRASQMVMSLSDRALLNRPTLTRMIAAQLPNVGWTRSAPLAKRYRTVEELIGATPEELMEIEGIGPKIAQEIWTSLRSPK